jgi:hypothetical protein
MHAMAMPAMVTMDTIPSSPLTTTPCHHVPWTPFAPLHPTIATIAGEEDPTGGTRRAQSAQGHAEGVVRAPVDMPWPRVASPAQPRPGPPQSTLSFAVAAPTHQTRSRVLAPPVAIDTVAVFPRTPPQTWTQCVATRPSPT